MGRTIGGGPFCHDNSSKVFLHPEVTRVLERILLFVVRFFRKSSELTSSLDFLLGISRQPYGGCRRYASGLRLDHPFESVVDFCGAPGTCAPLAPRLNLYSERGEYNFVFVVRLIRVFRLSVCSVEKLIVISV